MSSTRHADKNAPLRQERYSSAPEFNSFLKASAVARKCRILTNAAHKEICLYLQNISMQSGGLTDFYEDFLSRYGGRIGSQTMLKNKGRKTYNSDLVKIIRRELKTLRVSGDEFPLKGEPADMDPFGHEIQMAKIKDAEHFTDGEYEAAERLRQKQEASRFPSSYPASDFIEYCMSSAEGGLEDWLIRMCLDPAVSLDDPPVWFFELEGALKDYMDDRNEAARAGEIVTSIGEQINDALDYALEERCMVHVNGIARLGKTYQIKQWCRTHSGTARYIQVPSGQDDISFLRAIARELGTAVGSSLKATQIRQQIEDAIQDSGLMLVLDEAHLLWPQYKSVRSSPRRITWLMTAVVNKGVPVALVSTDQFDTYQRTLVDCTGWAAEQLEGRIAYRLDLPTVLPMADLKAIAKQNLPEAGKLEIDLLCEYARQSGKYLAAIDAISKRTRFVAKKAGRTSTNKKDIMRAIMEVDPLLAKKLSALVEKKKKEPIRKPSARAVKSKCRGSATPVKISKKVVVPTH